MQLSRKSEPYEPNLVAEARCAIRTGTLVMRGAVDQRSTISSALSHHHDLLAQNTPAFSCLRHVYAYVLPHSSVISLASVYVDRKTDILGKEGFILHERGEQEDCQRRRDRRYPLLFCVYTQAQTRIQP
jgi:hypothetical protein